MDSDTTTTNFVPEKLLIPLFLTSRNRIRLNRFLEIRRYISRKTTSYAKCATETTEDEENEEICEPTKRTTHKRLNIVKEKPSKKRESKLAPNRYNVPTNLNKRMGMLGAFWSQLKRDSGGSQKVNRNATAFYEIPRDTERFRKRCLMHKGHFTTDPRRRKPTSRFMISNIITCWRNPKYPSPITYFVNLFEPKQDLNAKQKPPVSHKFLRFSCVPEKANAAMMKTSSFDPGPGRYELRDDETALRIELLIDKQKCLKFRRLRYKSFQVKKVVRDPLWRHVEGFGFKRLFQGPLRYPLVVVTKKKLRKLDRDIFLFPSFDYIRMITVPDRIPLSIRTEDIVPKPRVMQYNCLVRVIIRRTIRNNKKLAFGSGMQRFPDSEMPMSRKAVKVPPLVDYPVMRVPVSQIQSRLHDLPARLRGTFNENRIRLFKFQPFPPVKLLLDENEVHPAAVDAAQMFQKDLIPTEYYKDEYKRHK